MIVVTERKELFTSCGPTQAERVPQKILKQGEEGLRLALNERELPQSRKGMEDAKLKLAFPRSPFLRTTKLRFSFQHCSLILNPSGSYSFHVTHLADVRGKYPKRRPFLQPPLT